MRSWTIADNISKHLNMATGTTGRIATAFTVTTACTDALTIDPVMTVWVAAGTEGLDTVWWSAISIPFVIWTRPAEILTTASATAGFAFAGTPISRLCPLCRKGEKENY